MNQVQCSKRQVKEAVALANKLKGGPFDPDGFTKKLVEAKMELRSLPENVIDERYFKEHRERLQRINEGNWVLGIVELESCLTWPRFGERKWASTGPVDVTAALVRNRNELTDRLW